MFDRIDAGKDRRLDPVVAMRVGRDYRIDKASLDAYIARNTIKPPAAAS